MFTHYKCGGNLIPIPDPFWFVRPLTGPTHLIDLARCDRCHFAGEIAYPPDES